MSDVKINFVEREIEVTVDLSLLTWGDLLKLQKAASGNVSEDAAEEMLNTIVSKVTDQDAAELPAMAVAQVLQAVMQKVQGGQAVKN